MQTLHFSQAFDSEVFRPAGAAQGAVFCGEKKLLRWLEQHLALGGYPENTEYLRIELFRQALAQVLQDEPEAFFRRSFEADRFATATALLAWRDELLLADWNFQVENNCPPRLATLARAEQIFQKKINVAPANVQAIGFADRFAQVSRTMNERFLPLEKVVLHEPLELLPVHVQRFIKNISEKNVLVEVAETKPSAKPNSNLRWLQDYLLGSASGKKKDENDGSLLILKAKQDADAAVFLAQLLGKNPRFHPVFIVPEMNLLLEQALIQEGFPAMGLLSASSARPSLQVLKLAPAFLWEPVDVFKIMEFVTLPVKPLDDNLATIVAQVLAAKPGLFNDTWFAAVFDYLEKHETPDEARKQYDFWFDRRRYRADTTAPKRDISLIYNYLREWAGEQFEKTGSKNASLLVLAEQARRIHDLLEAIPETRLSFLELERIVRAIYQPSPVQFATAEKKHFDFVHAPGGLAASAEAVVWWNCVYDDPTPTPEKWSPDEMQFFENQKVTLDSNKKTHARRLLLRNRAVLAAGEKLVLVVPEFVNGKEAEPNLLLGDISAAFERPEAFTFDLKNESDRAELQHFFQLPGAEISPNRNANRPGVLIELAQPELAPESEYETLTSLESLLYYPHSWFLKQKTRLFSTSIYSVSGDQRLLGNLSHRFFEDLLKEKWLDWDKKTIFDWVETKSETLLQREGATLLLYGREPEKNQFLNRVKNAAWSLTSLLRSNGWSVVQTEMDLEGHFQNVPVRGKADLVLARDHEFAIVDLKWSGARRRKDMIQNGEDLQLVLYAKLLPPPEDWAHTAYFILEDGKIIARNNLAFREAIVGGGGDDHRAANDLIFNKMEKTFRWRMEQLRSGKIEIRTARTAQELDFLYADQLLDLLEMKNEDARWDEFRTLVRG